MANEWKDPDADAAREAAERRETGGASVPAGGSKGPVRQAQGERDMVPAEPEDEPARRSASSEVPDPEREEAPELLGERSDYPMPRGDDEPA